MMMKRNNSNAKNTIYATIMTIWIATPFVIKITLSMSYTLCSKSINLSEYQWVWRKWYKQTFVTHFNELNQKKIVKRTKNLPDGELNPGLPRDRRGYSPLYYRGYVRLWIITTHRLSSLATWSFICYKRSLKATYCSTHTQHLMIN